MESQNYLFLNGQKIPLTDEQIETFGLNKLHGNPFANTENIKENVRFFCIDRNSISDIRPDSVCRTTLNSQANLFTNKAFAEKVYLHQLLYRKLLKYSYDHLAEDREWNISNQHYFINLIINDEKHSEFKVLNALCAKNFNDVYFSNYDVAQQALKDVVEPFMKEHPNFEY